MSKRKLTITGTALLAFALGLVTAGYTQERHPEIRAAQKMLAGALEHLAKADRDFSGHRTKAVEHIRAAQAELNEALASDKR